MPDTRTLRERMKKVAGQINWIPAFGKEREMDWLTNMHDWLISKKNRYWGLALPIWECKKCGNFEVIGSKEELQVRAVAGWKEFKGKSPHKPQIDAVKIKCSKCGAETSRIEPVGNPWLDAGIIPFSTISSNNQACNFEVTKTKPLYLTDKNEWLNWFPGDFITESFPGQFKNWFYSLIAMSTVLEDANPFKTVLGYGSMLDENGEAFHKSKGNSIEFSEGADKIGVDVMRWMYARANPAENLLFGYRIADEVRRRFYLKVWNIYNFFITYANLDGWIPQKVKSTNVLDRWLTARLNETVNKVTESLEKFDAFAASGEIEKFVDDFSLWYIRRSRNRVGPAAESEKDKNAFYSTCYQALITLCKILAPFMPFLPESIYSNLIKGESVHLENWPLAKVVDDKDSKMVSEMQSAREVVEKAHAIRKEKGITVKQPLNSFATTAKMISDEVAELIKDEINVKNLSWGAKADKLDTKITKELEEEARTRDLVRKIQDERKRLGLTLSQKANVQAEYVPENKKLLGWLTKKAQIGNLKVGKFKVTRA